MTETSDIQNFSNSTYSIIDEIQNKIFEVDIKIDYNTKKTIENFITNDFNVEDNNEEISKSSIVEDFDTEIDLVDSDAEINSVDSEDFHRASFENAVNEMIENHIPEWPKLEEIELTINRSQITFSPKANTITETYKSANCIKPCPNCIVCIENLNNMILSKKDIIMRTPELMAHIIQEGKVHEYSIHNQHNVF
ncbi:15521_t:CDS:2 [Dentiscutata erythropus]|uniref:15521_t:CDS:1 n=1 Tax=Dentiscutata erythropus TaxID=1348616 RepID=A0A9N9BV44_9GLOM|nr:15521_t:CDS:2 [Dentiscutata erythropus]